MIKFLNRYNGKFNKTNKKLHKDTRRKNKKLYNLQKQSDIKHSANERTQIIESKKTGVQQFSSAVLAQALQTNQKEKIVFNVFSGKIAKLSGLIEKFSAFIRIWKKIKDQEEEEPIVVQEKKPLLTTKTKEEVEALEKECEKLRAQSTQIGILTQENKVLMTKLNEYKKQNAPQRASIGCSKVPPLDAMDQLNKKSAEIANLSKQLASSQEKINSITKARQAFHGLFQKKAGNLKTLARDLRQMLNFNQFDCSGWVLQFKNRLAETKKG